MKLACLVLALVMSVASMDASAARRLGGGRSIGQQSSNVTQREAVRPATPPAAPAANPAAAPKAATPAPVPAAAPKRPWGAMLGGLAAGLGLAWLAHSLGMGEAFGNILMFALLAMVALVAIRWALRRWAPAPQVQPRYAFESAGGGLSKPYSPQNVGNDASARPWERSSFGQLPVDAEPAVRGSTSLIGSALPQAQAWGIPADFDRAGFLDAAKRNFVTLQDAWDHANMSVLRSMMTDTMLAEIRTQLTEREAATPGHVTKTEVVMLDAQLLGIEETADHYLASVEFSGLIREEPSAGPAPFREAWNLSKAKQGSAGWLVAGVQALQ